MFEDKDLMGKNCYDDYDYDEKDCCKRDDKCCRKPFVKLCVECGKDCMCLCGYLVGIVCKCNRKTIILKSKKGKKIFVNYDKVAYWTKCDYRDYC
ncbi:hypothetical protein [Oceanirhabdus seepicola]|uniref:Uncharacterized protein n=1 Tax=Oceanirhabdus seepicola TaxID=2828781 RepID=A0A9J6P680_9CLOT|nr:hypothetical protein [Oceanirhabdus seepicola]MCM1991638.1 hypothetical protein [Oceanirhabdus seepicola]